MTNAELAELRGEIYGLKILLFNCLAFIANLTEDPVQHLETIKDETIAGIAHATNEAVKPAHLEKFQGAAAGIVLQAVEAAKAAPAQPPQRRPVQ
jgi:hypothetical protein